MLDFFENLNGSRDMLLGMARCLARSRRWPTQLDPEDVVSSAIVRAVRSRDAFKGNTTFELKSWLLQILRTHSESIRRRLYAQKRGFKRTKSLNQLSETPHFPLEEFLDANLTSVSVSAQKEELLHMLYERVEQLGAEREAFLLRFEDGLTMAQIAEKLGCSEHKASALINRVIARLKSSFQE